ncbi:MAG: hypothetical protein E7307_00425 [Butyrivibrio sp.]|nr:hypothetical protein [Butyrivibrio sp.]
MSQEMHSTNTQSKNAAFWFVIANVAIKMVSFVTVIVLTRIIAVDEYGKYSVFNSYKEILFLFASFSLYNGAYLRGLLYFKEDKEALLHSIIAVSAVLTTIEAVLLFAFRNSLFGIVGLSIRTYIALVLLFYAAPALNCWIVYNRFEYKYKTAIVVLVLYNAVPLIATVLSTILISNTADTAIMAYLISQSIICIPFLLKSISFKSLAADAAKIRDIVKYSLTYQIPLVFHALSYYLLAQSDRMMISQMAGNDKAGIYSLAYGVASMLTIFQVSLQQGFQPNRLRQIENNAWAGFRKDSSYIMYVLTTIVVLFNVAFHDIYRIVFSEYYMEGMGIVPIVSASVVFMGAYSFYIDVETYYHKTRNVAAATVLCAILNMILNYVFIGYYGYIACAYTTLICYALLALIHLCFATKILKQSGVQERIIILKDHLICIVCLLLSIAVSIVFADSMIRYLFMVGVIVVVWIQRKRLFLL